MWEIHNSNLTQHIIFLSKNNKKSLISKRLESGENLQETNFIWDGSHLVQEIDHKTNRTYCYIYSHPNSYEPLAQLHFAKNSKNPTACYYYHNDQIGVPRELTDENGKLCWYGDYTGWGKLKNEYALVENIHQPFRLQNQYADDETGLHYNFFRYYEPNIGRFTQLDPIGLAGGENLYRFAPNVNEWVDPLGLAKCNYSIANHFLSCNADNPNEEIRIHSINSSCIHSGRGEHMNNINSVNERSYGPIWQGKFNMTPNTKPERQGQNWYALQEENWGISDSILYKLHLKRAGANLHLGSVSHGCITVSEKENCKNEYNNLIDFLNRELKAGYKNTLEVTE